MQDLVTGVENADTVSAYINIETPTGTIALKKTSEDGVVEGISFTIKGDNFNKTVKTGKDGSVSVEGLFPGTYTVTEQSIDRYEPQKTQTVTLIGGKTSTVTFGNTLKRGSLEIVKTSEDNLVEGMKFHLYGTSLSGLCGIIKKNKEVNHMEYKIIAVNRDETIDTIVETLSEDEYIEIMNNIHKLQTSMLSKDYYIVVRDNIRELLRFLPTIDIRDKHTFATINRYTYNVLGAFYAWIEYYESNYKAIFAPIKKKYYDKYFEYRMMYNLRIYMTHCEMAVTQVQLKFDEGEMFIYIEPSKLLENTGRLQKVFIPELQQMYDDGKRIDLYELMEEFEKMFSLMHKELLKGIEPEIQNIINQITPYLRFVDEKAQSCYIYEKETDKYIFSLTSFMGLFVNKMCNPY